jgi:DNA-directed RNA polymerase subunit RPC12/RpoP
LVLLLFLGILAMIAFACPRCTTRIERHDSESLTKVACPGCGQRLQVPQAPQPEAQTIMGKLLPVPAMLTSRKPPEESPAKTIRCVCPHCQAVIKAPPKAAGSRAPCPRCGMKVEIPVPRAEPLEEVLPVLPVVTEPVPLPAGLVEILYDSSPVPVQPNSLVQNKIDVNRWYICGSGPNEQGKVYGPFALSKLQQFVTEGRLLADDLVCKEGSEDWVPACTVNGLVIAVSEPRPPGQIAPRPQPSQPIQSTPVVVNVVNNTNVSASATQHPPPLPQKVSGGGRKKSAFAGILARLIIYPILFIVIGLVALTILNPEGKVSLPAIFKKSPKELIVGQWHNTSDPQAPDLLFYKDGVVEGIVKGQVMFKGKYSFVDDDYIEMNSAGRSKVSFPSNDELVVTQPDGKKQTWKRVK